MPGTDVDRALERGLAFLARQQEPDGSFVSWSSASMRPFRRLRDWRTVFVPALMLGCLSVSDLPAALKVRRRLADFLLAECGRGWAFNYWARGAAEHRSMPYPNDLDDTFCALAGLYLHDPSLVDETALADAVKLLLATETAVGGPYRTWLVPPDSEPVWLDVDMAVNANIAYFLSLVSNRLPALDDLMGEAIRSGRFSSPYYPTDYPFAYYFARAYGGSDREALLRRVRRLHRQASTDLDRALCLTARSRLGDPQDPGPAIQRLLAGQRRDGSWPAATFYADPEKDGKLYYDGAPALTTAFALEALTFYAREPKQTSAPVADSFPGRPVGRVAPARQAMPVLPSDLRRATTRELCQLADSGNGREIIGLPARFAASLQEPPRLPAGFLTGLGAANLCGWLAYTIYDDFLDDEGRPGLLPSANAALRLSLDGFLEALPEDRRLVKEVFDTIDGANAWELSHCRFTVTDDRITIGRLPDYGDLSKLAERSLGHTLAPIAVLRAAGADGAAIRHVREALTHYLIDRQLNDDLHDWQEDLANGHITYVVARLLAGARIRGGTSRISELQTRVRRHFWSRTLPAVCRDMRRHIAAGRQSLARSGILTESDVVNQLLDGLETSVEETLKQQREAENFLKEYAA